ncbi:MAG TPA: hypothetical protein VMT17_06375 [Anaeromyxobacteraceae bacterium]|nr:hypothetical protein [Anaeromyxobacteraceae bacterium]
MSASTEFPAAARDLLSVTGALAEEVAKAPWPVAALLLALGLVELAAGARLRRPVAAVGGALLGALAASAFRDALEGLTGLSAATLRGVAAAVSGGLCAAYPPLFPAAAGALPFALAAGAIAPEAQRSLALGLGGAAGAAIGVVAARPVAALVAAWIGASATALGLAGLLRGAGAPRMAAHPAAVVAAAAVLTVAGFAYQLPSAWRSSIPRDKRGEGPSKDGGGTPAS